MSKLGALINELYSHDKLPRTPQEYALWEDRTSRALRADIDDALEGKQETAQ